MAQQAYRIAAVPNFARADWHNAEPELRAAVELFFSLMAHCGTLPQKPVNIRFRSGWIEVVLSDPLDPAMEAHIGVTRA